jgi:cobalt-zinc-cadmium efflux system protein
MAHNHDHYHTHKSGLSLAFWLNLFFSIIEVVGGLLTHSTAIIADAFHDFMDAMAIGMAVFLEKVSGRKRTAQFSYGYRRFSLLAALGMSVFLLAGVVLMVVSAINSFSAPKEVNSIGMLWLAVLGVAVNGLAFVRIKKGSGHSHHGHGHTHNHNSRAIMLHLLEDVLGWIAVLVGAVVIYFTNWFWIDGVLTLLIAAFVGFNATKNLVSTLKILLQSVPENVDVASLTHELKQLQGIKDIHDVHVWSLDGNYNVGSLHAVVNTAAEQYDNNIYSAIVKLMKKHHIQHPTVQLEMDGQGCEKC